MIRQINDERKLKKYLHHNIEDAGVKVDVDAKLKEAEYIGIKVDEYYMGLREAIIPKAVDFIVAVDCKCDWYMLYILELKGVKRTASSKDIQEKFRATIEQFMSVDFASIFKNDKYKYRDIKLYLVTTSYLKSVKNGNYSEYQKIRSKLKMRDTLENDSTLSQTIYKFRGICCRIEREFPPNPLIRSVT